MSGSSPARQASAAGRLVASIGFATAVGLTVHPARAASYDQALKAVAAAGAKNPSATFNTLYSSPPETITGAVVFAFEGGPDGMDRAAITTGREILIAAEEDDGLGRHRVRGVQRVYDSRTLVAITGEDHLEVVGEAVDNYNLGEVLAFSPITPELSAAASSDAKYLAARLGSPPQADALRTYEEKCRLTPNADGGITPACHRSGRSDAEHGRREDINEDLTAIYSYSAEFHAFLPFRWPSLSMSGSAKACGVPRSSPRGCRRRRATRLANSSPGALISSNPETSPAQRRFSRRA